MNTPTPTPRDSSAPSLPAWMMTPKYIQEEKLLDKYLDAGLSFRAARSLAKAGVKSKKGFVSAVRKGVLVPSKKPRNYGAVTHAEICKWAGVAEPIKKKWVLLPWTPKTDEAETALTVALERAIKAEADLAAERARLDWLETPSGMDWQWEPERLTVSRASIDAAMTEENK